MDSIWIYLVSAPFGVGVTLLIMRWQDRRMGKRSYLSLKDDKKHTLTVRDRSDIYRDMAWWDREFRKLCGEPEPTSQLSDNMNFVIEQMQKFGLVATVEELKPVSNITYLYDPEKDYQAEMKKAFND